MKVRVSLRNVYGLLLGGGISHSIIWYCMVWSETQGIAWHGIVLGGIFWYSMLLTLGVFCYWEVWSSKTRLQ